MQPSAPVHEELSHYYNSAFSGARDERYQNSRQDKREAGKLTCLVRNAIFLTGAKKLERSHGFYVLKLTAR